MSGWRTVRLGDVVEPSKIAVAVEDDREYVQVTVRIHGRGLVRRRRAIGAEIATKRQFLVRAGQLLVSRIDARNGGLGIVPPELDSAVVSGDFPVFDIDTTVCVADYLGLLVGRPAFWDECQAVSEGSTNRVRLVLEQFLDLEIELPRLDEQRVIVEAVSRVSVARRMATALARAAEQAFRAAGQEVFDSSEAEWTRLGDIAQLTSGGTPSRSEPANYGGSIPWVKTGEVRFNVLISTEETISDLGLRNSSAKVFPVGTVLLAMYGQGATRGRCALLGRAMATNQACAAVLPCSDLEPRYLFHFLWSRYEAIREESEGSAQDNLNQTTVADIEVPVPDLETQAQVVGRLDAFRELADAYTREADVLKGLEAILADELIFGERSLHGDREKAA